MADQNISLAVTGRNEAKRALNDVINDLGRTQKAVNNTAGSTKKMQDGFKGVGRGAGMAGIQIQQFVGQLQGGVNPMVALSQQSADLGFALGVPLVGAVVSIAAALGTMLIPQLLAAGKAFSDLRSEIKSVGLDIDDLPAELIVSETKRLEEASKDAVDAFKSQEAAIQNLKDRVEEEESFLRSQGLTNEQVARQTLGLRGEIDRLSAKLPNLTAEVILTQARLKNFKDEVSGNGESMEEWYKSLEDAEIVTRRFIRTTAGLEGIFPTAMVTDEDPFRVIPLTENTEKYIVTQERLGETVKKTAMTMEDVGKKSLSSMEDSLVDLVSGTKSAASAFKDMARSIVSDLIRMYIQQRITAPLFNAMFGQTPTTYTTIAPAGPPTVGGTEAFFEGGGYTGNGHRVGGVDGRGGFPAILHPNETIIDHQKGQSGSGGVTVNLNISTGVSQTVRAEIANMMPQIANATKAAVADARMRGGSFSGAMGV